MRKADREASRAAERLDRPCAAGNRPFDTDLLACHLGPLVTLLEPEGWTAFNRQGGRQVLQYRKHVPATIEVAEALYRAVPSPWRWACQMEDGGWPQKTAGRWIDMPRQGAARSQGEGSLSSVRVRQQPLRLIDVAKHLCGVTFALGNLDNYVVGFEEASVVRCLRVDIDMDDAHAARDTEAILAQMRGEREAAHALGLGYMAHRTGGRGHQFALALPLAVHRPVASFLLHLVKRLVTGRMVPGAEFDKSNLTSIMRLPGGLHAKTKRLGLFVDVDAGGLYPLLAQVELLKSRFSAPFDVYPERLDKATFRAAAQQIADVLKAAGVRRWERLDNRTFQAAMARLRDNLFVRAYHGVLFGEQVDVPEEREEPEKAPPPDAAVVFAVELPAPDDLPCNAAAPEVDDYTELEAEDWGLAWAWRTIMMGYPAKGFQRYIRADGDKAIRAFYRVYETPERVLAEMEEQARTMPHLSAADVDARLSLLRSLVPHHEYIPLPKRPRSRLVVTGEDRAFAQMVLSTINTRRRERGEKAIRKGSSPILEALFFVILHEFKKADSDTVHLSHRQIARYINAGFAPIRTNRTSVGDYLKLLCVGEDCRFEMLRVSDRPRGRREGVVYVAWKELREAPWGQGRFAPSER